MGIHAIATPERSADDIWASGSVDADPLEWGHVHAAVKQYVLSGLFPRAKTFQWSETVGMPIVGLPPNL